MTCDIGWWALRKRITAFEQTKIVLASLRCPIVVELWYALIVASWVKTLQTVLSGTLLVGEIQCVFLVLLMLPSLSG